MLFGWGLRVWLSRFRRSLKIGDGPGFRGTLYNCDGLGTLRISCTQSSYGWTIYGRMRQHGCHVDRTSN